MARTRFAASVAVMAFLFGTSAFAQEYSGAFYVGDANGNGYIEPVDITRAQQFFATGAADYSAVHPPAWDVAELSGNGFIDAPDFAILQNWYINSFPARNGEPFALAAVGFTTLGYLAGDSVEVCVELDDQAGVGDPFATDRSGWGVNFAIDQTPGLCTIATIYGRNPWGIVKDDYGYYQKAYEYTDRMDPNGNGRACVRVVTPPTGCEGLDIKVNAYVPSDSEALCNGQPFPCYGTVGRSPVQLDGPTFTLTTTELPVLTVSPDPASVVDGGSLQMTATSSMAGDVTASAAWSIVSGPCVMSGSTPGLVIASEGCSDGACVVQADYDTLSDTAAVTVTNDETVITLVDVTPEGPMNVAAGWSGQFYCEGYYADACSTDCTASAAWELLPGGCPASSIDGSGYYTGDPDGGCSDTVQGTYASLSDSETVLLAAIPVLAVTPDPAAVNDGATVRMTAIDQIDGDVTQSPSTTWSVTSGTCTVSNTAPDKGLVSTPEGCSNLSCTVEAVYNPGVSRSDNAAVNVTNDETTVVGVDVTPEGPINAYDYGMFIYFTCTATTSDLCETDCTAVANWSVGGCGGWMFNPGEYIAYDHCAGDIDTVTADYAGFSDDEVVIYPSGLRYDGSALAFNDGFGYDSDHSYFPVDERLVRLEIGDTCTPGASGDINCWIRLINLDPDEYMANTFIEISDWNCGGELNNADLYMGDTIHGILADGNAGAPAPLDGAAMCYLEDGASYNNGFYSYFNIFGAKTQTVPQGSAKPFQVLHPKAGEISYLWELRGLTTGCIFHLLGTADWFPWNPVGADGQPWGGDDDPRYDFQDYTTVYLMLADFNSKIGYSELYARGAWKRSNVLAGYSAPGAKSGTTIYSPGGAPGTDAYFSVNVAVEYPDRIESQVMGAPGAFDSVNGYEYYNTYAVFFRWDPAVVAPVGVNHFAQRIFTGPRPPCWIQDQCNIDGRQNYQHLAPFDPAFHGLIDSTNGFIYFYRQIYQNFEYYSTTMDYVTDGGGIIRVLFGNNKEGGHHGVAVWDRAYLGGTIPYGYPFSIANGRTQQGPDPEPEVNLLNFHFWTLPGTSGKGTSFRVDTFSGYTTFILSHTGTTFYPSGPGEPTDWHAYCSPYSPGHANPTDQHCDPALLQSDYAVYHGQENVNTQIGHSGEALYGGTGSAGSVQQWPVYIVVQ